MAYGVDQKPNPDESRSGHWEYDWDADLQRNVRVWVSEEDEE